MLAMGPQGGLQNGTDNQCWVREPAELSPGLKRELDILTPTKSLLEKSICSVSENEVRFQKGNHLWNTHSGLCEVRAAASVHHSFPCSLISVYRQICFSCKSCYKYNCGGTIQKPRLQWVYISMNKIQKGQQVETSEGIKQNESKNGKGNKCGETDIFLEPVPLDL